MTHGAVSQQIRKLEAELGARLFTRQGNAMIPTPAAARLAGEVARGLDIMHEAVRAFSQAAERDPLVVSLDPQFGTRWLPRRLPRLLNHPAGTNIEFRIETRTADFVTDGVDMGIRYGRAISQDVERTLLFREELFPVCSPGLAAAHDIRTPADLLSAPLLHHSHRPWKLWFSAFGLAEPAQRIAEFEDSLMLLEAAAQGMGVALGRSALIEQELISGRLVRVLPDAVHNDFAFYAVWRADSAKLARIHALRAWLLEEISQRENVDA